MDLEKIAAWAITIGLGLAIIAMPRKLFFNLIVLAIVGGCTCVAFG